MSIMTNMSNEEYYQVGHQFKSPLFDFTYNNFMVKRTEYCYAGEWSGVLDIKTGILKKCYAEPGGINIFDDIDVPIPFEAVGSKCRNMYCVNSSHFMSLGVIPSLKTPSYAELRNRKEAGWYTKEMEEFLSGKLSMNNKKHSFLRKVKNLNIREWLSHFKFYQALHRIKVKLYE